MKRSRRSLGLLLASMALSLLVLRATTLPGRQTIRTHEKNAPRSVVPASAARPVRQQTLLTKTSRQRAVGQQASAFMSRAVSMSAYIVVMPQDASTEPVRQADAHQATSWRRRAGWSGCTAYANGCDHLGGAYTSRPRSRSSTHQRLFFSALERLLGRAVASASASADFVGRIAAHDRLPSLASDSARPKQDR